MPTLQCIQCGSSFHVPPFRIKENARFCSLPCWYARRRVGSLNAGGYRRLTINGKNILEHRWIMEQHLGRKLLRSEHVHHLNGDKLDNRLENLVVMSHAEHNREHHPLKCDLERAIAMRAEGLSLYEIGKAFGVTYNAVRNAFIRYGLHTPKRH